MTKYYIEFDVVRVLSQIQMEVLISVCNLIKNNQRNGKFEPLEVYLPNFKSSIDLEYSEHSRHDLMRALHDLLDYGLLSFEPFDELENRKISIVIEHEVFIKKNRTPKRKKK